MNLGEEMSLRLRLNSMLKSATPYLLIIAMQFASAGVNIITSFTFHRGMSSYVFVVYRNAMAAVVLTPFALFFERNVRPKMTFPVFWRIMLLGGLDVVLNQGLACLGMVYMSASYASAIFNALPSITFLLAVILRIEQVRIKEVRSKAKVIGTLITFAGALFMAIYRGPILNNFRSSHENDTNFHGHHWNFGTIFLCIACVGCSTFSILQSMVLTKYPAELSLSCLICFLGTIEAVGIAIAFEHNPRAWAIGWDVRLFAPLYAGVVTTGIMFYVQRVVIRTRGPVFVTAFNPLRVIIVIILAFPILHDTHYLGSVIGSVVVFIGVYIVIWGKGKDRDGQKLATETKGTATVPESNSPSDKSQTQISQMRSLSIVTK